MINSSLLLRAAGKHPSIQVRERSAWVRDFPDVSRSCLNSSRIPDCWEVSRLCSARGIGAVHVLEGIGVRPRAASPSRGRSTRAARARGAARTGTNPACAIDTSAASALSGTVKPALRRHLGVSTNARRRRCDIRLTIANGRGNGADGRRLNVNHRVEWEPAPGRAGATVGTCR